MPLVMASPTLSQMPTPQPAPPPSPMPWLWACHMCHSIYRFSCTQRCLECSHEFCTSVTGEESAQRNGRSSSKRRRTQADGPCYSEFDYNGWAAWSAYRRMRCGRKASGTAETVDAFAEWESMIDEERGNVRAYKEALFVLERHDCSVHCDYPSECHQSRYAAAVEGRTAEILRSSRGIARAGTKQLPVSMQKADDSVRHHEAADQGSHPIYEPYDSPASTHGATTSVEPHSSLDGLEGVDIDSDHRRNRLPKDNAGSIMLFHSDVRLPRAMNLKRERHESCTSYIEDEYQAPEDDVDSGGYEDWETWSPSPPSSGTVCSTTSSQLPDSDVEAQQELGVDPAPENGMLGLGEENDPELEEL